MKKMIRKIDDTKTLWRDEKTGLAWVRDRSTGLLTSAHPSIHHTGSVKGMKNLGYWDKHDRTIQCNGYTYNIDKLAYDRNDPIQQN